MLAFRSWIALGLAIVWHGTSLARAVRPRGTLKFPGLAGFSLLRRQKRRRIGR